MKNKSLILATSAAMAVIVAWNFTLPGHDQKNVVYVNPDKAVQPATYVGRDQALALAPRIAINSPHFQGSISLRTGAIDDLSVVNYGTKPTMPFNMLSPDSARAAGSIVPFVSGSTWDGSPRWTSPATELTPEHPASLQITTPKGLVITNTYTVDQEYLITIIQKVENRGTKPAKVNGGIGLWVQQDKTRNGDNFDTLTSTVGTTAANTYSISDLQTGTNKTIGAGNGWTSFTSRYWLLAATSGDHVTAVSSSQGIGGEVNVTSDDFQLLPGASTTFTKKVIAAPKTRAVLTRYEGEVGFETLGQVIDYGWLSFLAKPLSRTFEAIADATGSAAFAIFALVVILKTGLFPLARIGHVETIKMKALKPKLDELKSRLRQDPAALRKEMGALYKREAVNPAAMMFSLLLQLPLLFAFYKLFSVEFVLRQAPLFGWITDLGTPDPTSWVNFFGLLQIDLVHAFQAPALGAALHLLSFGLWPLFMGLSLFLQQFISKPSNTTQKRFLQLVFVLSMFVFGHVQVAIVFYCTLINLLSIAQTAYLQRRVKPALAVAG